jgi:hypothetical protein
LLQKRAIVRNAPRMPGDQNTWRQQRCATQRKRVQELQTQAATIAKQQKQIEALTAGLQKVSAQIEVSKPAPQTVLNNQ